VERVTVAAGAVLGLAAALYLCGGVMTPADGASVAYVGRDNYDGQGAHWYHWVLHTAPSGGAPSLHTDVAYHPWGVDLGAQTGANFLDVLIAWPLRAVAGWPACFNVLCVLLLALNFATFVPLGLHLSRGRPAPALAAAAVWAFNPWVLHQLTMGETKNTMLWAIPLMVLGLVRLRRRRGWGWPLLAGVSAGLVGLAYWFYGLFMLPVAAVWLATVRAPAGGWRAFGVRLGLATGIGACLVVPVLAWSLASGGQALPGFVDGPGFAVLEAAFVVQGEGLAGYLRHAPASQEIFGLTTRTVPTASGTPIVLVPGAALAAVAVFAVVGRRRPLVLGGMALALLLALGPVLDTATPRVNPAYLAASWAVPFYSRLSWPTQQLMVFYLGLAVCVASAFRFTGHRRVGVRWLARAGLAGVLGALGLQLAATNLVPLPVTSYTEPALFARLDAVGEGHLVQVPYRDCLMHNVDQMHHGRKVLVGGHGFLPRRLQPAGFQELYRTNELVSSLDALTTGASSVLVVRDGDVRQLRALGYRFVVLYDDLTLPPGGYPRMGREIGRHFQQVAADGHGTAFDLAVPMGPLTPRSGSANVSAEPANPEEGP